MGNRKKKACPCDVPVTTSNVPCNIPPHVPHCDDAVRDRRLLSGQPALPLVRDGWRIFRMVYSRDLPEGGTEGLVEYANGVVVQEAGATDWGRHMLRYSLC